jgi:hypothetical protein
MIVGIQGTNQFSDYNVFLRAMSVALYDMDEADKEFVLYSAGPARINTMAMEFVNVSERGMKSRGRKIKLFKVPPSWISENISTLNYFVFMSKPKEPVSKLVSEAETAGVDVGIYRY